MSTPPTALHTTPPTPVKAMMMPMKKPARCENQRLTRVDGARKSSIVRLKPITTAAAKNCHSALT